MQVIYFFFLITFLQISQQDSLYILKKTLFDCCLIYINLQAQSVELREGAFANVKMISTSFFFVGLARSLNEVSVLCIFLFSFI